MGLNSVLKVTLYSSYWLVVLIRSIPVIVVNRSISL